MMKSLFTRCQTYKIDVWSTLATSITITNCRLFSTQKLTAYSYSISSLLSHSTQKKLLFWGSPITMGRSKKIHTSNKKTQPWLSNKTPRLRAPSSVNLVIMGTGGPGATGSILITTEYSRYLFNCGEGTQRMGAISKVMKVDAYAKLKGLEHIFITSKRWENIGGLLGLSMMLEGQRNPGKKDLKKTASQSRKPWENPQEADRNRGPAEVVPKINLYGPQGVETFVLMARKFSEKLNMEISGAQGEFEDSALRVTPIELTAESSEQSDMPQSSEDGNDEDSSLVEPAGKRPRLDEDMGTPRQAFAYICKLKGMEPKINVEKCLNAGVTIGPLVGQLQKGQSVTLDDGTVVHPDQVTDPVEERNLPILVLDCPSPDFLPALDRHPQLARFSGPGAGPSSEALDLVVHFTPSEVFHSDTYQAWMKRLWSGTNHLVLNREAGETGIARVVQHQSLLGLVSPEIFPSLPHTQLHPDMASIQPYTPLDPDQDNEQSISAEAARTSIPEGDNKQSVSAEAARTSIPEEDNKQSVSAEAARTSCPEETGRIVRASPGLFYTLRGKQTGFHVDLPDKDNVSPMVKEARTDKVVQKEIETFQTKLSQLSDQSSLKYPKVVFLGTGSSEPNKIRNQSCILVQHSKHSAVILDCGEDSYGQLYRFFGQAKSRQLLCKVQAIFVSHVHTDHHLGLMSLLKERKLAFEAKCAPFSPVTLMAPLQMGRWLRFYHSQVEPITHLFRFHMHQDHVTSVDPLFQVIEEDELKDELELLEYKAVPVIHCPNAYGVSMRHKNGFKLVYSGDTRPCQDLVEEGKDCDLLIHEATHEDALIENAKVTKHSTFSEAIDVGRQMCAKHVVLTHFSQRYAYMVPLDPAQLPGNVGVAFDNMQVVPSSLSHLPHMIPALTAIFAEGLQKLEQKILKKKQNDAEAS